VSAGRRGKPAENHFCYMAFKICYKLSSLPLTPSGSRERNFQHLGKLIQILEGRGWLGDKMLLPLWWKHSRLPSLRSLPFYKIRAKILSNNQPKFVTNIITTKGLQPFAILIQFSLGKRNQSRKCHSERKLLPLFGKGKELNEVQWKSVCVFNRLWYDQNCYV